MNHPIGIKKKKNQLSKTTSTSGLYDFTYNFNQIVKKGLIPIVHKFFHRKEKKGAFPNLFYEANVTIKSKLDKDNAMKKNYRPMLFMQIDGKIPGSQF